MCIDKTNKKSGTCNCNMYINNILNNNSWPPPGMIYRLNWETGQLLIESKFMNTIQNSKDRDIIFIGNGRYAE